MWRLRAAHGSRKRDNVLGVEFLSLRQSLCELVSPQHLRRCVAASICSLFELTSILVERWPAWELFSD